MRNIRIRKANNGKIAYGKKPVSGYDRNLFGWQDGIAEKYLSKKLTERGTAKIVLSDTPETDFREVRVVQGGTWEKDNFRVTYPKALRGHEFCAEGFARYVPQAKTQKHLKFYFKIVNS